MELIYQEKDINQAAEWLWAHIENDYKVVAVYGQMGAGKTTLVHALCNYLQVQDAVSSPTFSIINEYSFPSIEGEEIIYHIDLYRLKDEEEAIRAGVEDCLYSDSYCFVEWPERALSLLPPNTLNVFISLVADGKRKLEIRKN